MDGHLNICILGLRFSYFYVAEGPIELLLSVHLSVQHFCQDDSLVFSDFRQDGKYLEYLKTGRGKC